MDICARVDMNVGISFVRLSIVNANECVRIVSGQHMARNTRATQTPGRERFFLQGAPSCARGVAPTRACQLTRLDLT